MSITDFRPTQGQWMDAHDRFEQLYLAEAAVVLRYVRYRVGGDVAEDVVADTFAIAWQKLGSVPEPARPWLLATARRVSANYLRARRRQLASRSELTEFLDCQDGTAAVDRRHDLIAALNILPALDREAVLLVTWYDLSHADAARVMDCSTTAFTVRLHRARRRLRQALTAPNHPTASLHQETKS